MRQLATASGVSSSHLGRIERGEHFPSAHILRKIAKPLGFKEGELFTLAGYLSPEPSLATESKAQPSRLNPHVAKVLSEEPVDVQRTVVAVLSMLKSMTKGMTERDYKVSAELSEFGEYARRKYSNELDEEF